MLLFAIVAIIKLQCCYFFGTVFAVLVASCFPSPPSFSSSHFALSRWNYNVFLSSFFLSLSFLPLFISHFLYSLLRIKKDRFSYSVISRVQFCDCTSKCCLPIYGVFYDEGSVDVTIHKSSCVIIYFSSCWCDDEFAPSLQHHFLQYFSNVCNVIATFLQHIAMQL